MTSRSYCECPPKQKPTIKPGCGGAKLSSLKSPIATVARTTNLSGLRNVTSSVALSPSSESSSPIHHQDRPRLLLLPSVAQQMITIKLIRFHRESPASPIDGPVRRPSVQKGSADEALKTGKCFHLPFRNWMSLLFLCFFFAFYVVFLCCEESFVEAAITYSPEGIAKMQ